MEILVNTLKTEDIESKINYFREGAQKFIGFLVAEDYFSTKVMESLMSSILMEKKKQNGIEQVTELGLPQMDSIIELFNRAGAFLVQQLNKEFKDKDKQNPYFGHKRFEFVEKSFAILEKIW